MKPSDLLKVGYTVTTIVTTSDYCHHAEMVEHDVSPVVMEPVREEPHPQQPEDSPSSEPAGDKEAEGVVSEDQEAVSGGMSGFLSSFAAVVQTTVSV